MISLLIAGVLSLPLDSHEPWRQVSYGGIPSNEVTFGQPGMHIKVEASTSPLFYSLGEVRSVAGLKVKGEIGGFPKIDGKEEGEGKADDFCFRIGLVSPSDSGLSWLQKIFAPKWIRELSELMPDRGVEKVYFFNVAQTMAKGFQREHPKSDKLVEEVVVQTRKPGAFTLDKILETPIPTFAVWIQSDGDDSKSTFEIKILSIELAVSADPPSSVPSSQ
jgi:hypothetical protein